MGIHALRGLLLLGSFFIGARVVSAQAVPAQHSLATLLKTSKWQKRVLLLCAPTPDNIALLHQRQLLAAAHPSLEAREVLVREVLINKVSAADRKYLTQTLRVSSTGFTLLLVGKDGGTKRRETEPVTLSSLLATIDAMPMRRQEMQK